jgi:SAM-dependent methyltransferase
VNIQRKLSMNNDQYCAESSDKALYQDYWDTQYKAKSTGWDLGQISPPIKEYIDTLNNKNYSILIPGCGNSYEAEYLLQEGFTNITVIDIAPTLVEELKQKFADNSSIKIIQGDFFEHKGKYDLIIEQTFFCALPPTMRQKYVWKMHQLLVEDGILVGLLFNRSFEAGPPFGGSQQEYEKLFGSAFILLKMHVAPNSVVPRANSELFFEFKKNSSVKVNLYQFEGTIRADSMAAIKNKFEALNAVINASTSTNFAEVLIVSRKEILIEELQKTISDDEKHSIIKLY